MSNQQFDKDKIIQIFTAERSESLMKNHSFYQFILREINKNSMNRMNLPTFTRVIRKKAQDVPTSQLLFLYRELQRLKSSNSQFHKTNEASNYSEKQKSIDSKSVMKFESYEKHTLICLQEIAIKIKEKNGFEQGVDLCKLFYLRLLNVIDYHLPYVNVLQQFREEFLWKDIGQEVIDYVALIERDPTNFGTLLVQTVNQIIHTVSQELQNIDILQLSYLKSVLSKGKQYGIYEIEDQLIERLDLLISQNKFAYSFRELQNCLSSDHKNKETHQYLALITKDQTDKKLNYLYIDSKNDLLNLGPQKVKPDIKRQIGLPGKSITEESIDHALKRLSETSLFGVYMNIFQVVLKEKQLNTMAAFRQYIKYHFNYFSKSGNVNSNTNNITEILSSILSDQAKMKEKGIKYTHLQVFKLFFVIEMLSRKSISGKQLIESHSCLKNELQMLNSMQRMKQDHLGKIFDGSMMFFGQSQTLEKLKPLMLTFSHFINTLDEKTLANILSGELEAFSQSEKTFIMNQLITCLVNNLKNSNSRQFTRATARLLELFMKCQFKKFSIETSNIQKILSLLKQQIEKEKSKVNEQKGILIDEVIKEIQNGATIIFEDKEPEENQSAKLFNF